MVDVSVNFSIPAELERSSTVAKTGATEVQKQAAGKPPRETSPPETVKMRSRGSKESTLNFAVPVAALRYGDQLALY